MVDKEVSDMKRSNKLKGARAISLERGKDIRKTIERMDLVELIQSINKKETENTDLSMQGDY